MRHALGLAALVAACTPSPEQLLEEMEIDLLDLGPAPADAVAVLTVDPAADPELVFSARGLLGVAAWGTWSRYNVRVSDRGDGPASYLVELAVDTDSVQTGNTRLDEHLRTPDFFDVEGFPRATFQSTGLTPIEGDTWEVRGDMTLRGTTRELRWRSTITEDGDRVHATGEIPFSRWAFGLVADDVSGPGGDGASDEVTVTYDVWLTPPPR